MLRTGGLLLADDAGARSGPPPRAGAARLGARTSTPAGPDLRFYTARSLRALLEDFGFEEIRVRGRPRPAPLLPPRDGPACVRVLADILPTPLCAGPRAPRPTWPASSRPARGRRRRRRGRQRAPPAAGRHRLGIAQLAGRRRLGAARAARGGRARWAPTSSTTRCPPTPGRRRTAQVITVHDLAFERLPEAFDRRYAAWARRAHRAAARRAGAVVCPTEATAATSAPAGACRQPRVVVAPHGPGQRLPAVPPEPEPRHFLYVGDDEPRKNLAALRAAHARYSERAQRPLPLVVAGAAGEPVSPERLAALYAGAAAVVHPALHEGFGLTLAEAMRRRRPRAGRPLPRRGRDGGRRRPVRRPARSRGPGPRARAARGRCGAARRALRTRSQLGRRLSWAGSARAHISAYTLALG